ncbi:hypothetical protein [Gracilinema caldarium]|nr:hypothetical protein [Gracilinema caldarium]
MGKPWGPLFPHGFPRHPRSLFTIPLGAGPLISGGLISSRSSRFATESV